MRRAVPDALEEESSGDDGDDEGAEEEEQEDEEEEGDAGGEEKHCGQQAAEETEAAPTEVSVVFLAAWGGVRFAPKGRERTHTHVSKKKRAANWRRIENRKRRMGRSS